MKIKNPFKKGNIMDTVVNVGVGGAANVAIDYAVANVETLAGLDKTYVRAGKVVLGAILGGMVSNKYLRAAADGIATVGASELISSYVAPADPTSGLRPGTIGRLRAGNRAYRRAIHGTSGVGASFMGK